MRSKCLIENFQQVDLSLRHVITHRVYKCDEMISMCEQYLTTHDTTVDSCV